MQTRQINKLVMYLALRKYVSDPRFADAISKLPVFGTHCVEFQDAANVIRLRRQSVLDLNASGLTENKDALREELAEKAASLSACVVAYAKNQSDENLAQKAHLTNPTFGIRAGKRPFETRSTGKMIPRAEPVFTTPHPWIGQSMRYAAGTGVAVPGQAFQEAALDRRQAVCSDS